MQGGCDGGKRELAVQSLLTISNPNSKISIAIAGHAAEDVGHIRQGF
jgi:hypothetical protein